MARPTKQSSVNRREFIDTFILIWSASYDIVFPGLMAAILDLLLPFKRFVIHISSVDLTVPRNRWKRLAMFTNCVMCTCGLAAACLVFLVSVWSCNILNGQRNSENICLSLGISLIYVLKLRYSSLESTFLDVPLPLWSYSITTCSTG